MSNRFNYFMATPYSNPSRKAQAIEKKTNELPKDEKTEVVTETQTPQVVEQNLEAETTNYVVEEATTKEEVPTTEPVETVTL